jgi:D-alanyl-D-alanine carboxypeptidase
MVRVPFLIACCALLASCNNDSVSLESRYLAAAQGVVAQYRIPGALVAVRVPGNHEWSLALGESDVAHRTPMDRSSHFPIRSITKAFTVTALLQLVRDGTLTLDQTVDRYVAGIPNGDTITLADLAGMQSGLADYSGTDAFRAAFGADPGRVWTSQQLIDFAIPSSPKFSPRAQYDYSNTNTVLLGMVVAKATGKPVGEVITASIVDALGLEGTAYATALLPPDPHPTPYEVDQATGDVEVDPFISPSSLDAAGAMVSTLDDLSVWAAALGDGRLIGATLQRVRMDSARAATNGPTYDIYGLGIGSIKGWWGHTGSGIGFQVAAMYDPRSHATIAVMVNATPSNTPVRDLNLAQEMFAALADVVATR